MDLLSDAVAAARSEQPWAARIAWHSPWGMRFPDSRGASFQLVLQGSCWVLTEGNEPLPLGVGDVLFLPHGEGYALADRPDAPVSEMTCAPALRRWEEGGGPDAPLGEYVCDGHGARPHPRFGSAVLGTVSEDPATCVTVGGCYRNDSTRPHPLLSELPPMVHLPAGVGQRPEVAAAIDLLGRELNETRHGRGAVIPSLLDVLLMYILRAVLEEHRPDRMCGWVSALRDPAVNAAIQAVHADPAHPWTVAGMGERAGLSRAAFSRRFTSMVGQSPLAYVTWWRLTRARELLERTDVPISAIAARVGYGSQFAFANAFKREFGIAPGRYRAGFADAS
ncbi:AraC family transcriptional regulator [Nocardiopsis sp. NPDC050513]|uniref:AraC family transcriptional regulator n=1 Tax=Nocardiopsis sp. NPDC050513 TaxID=3364338 RepID=UPI0037B51598